MSDAFDGIDVKALYGKNLKRFRNGVKLSQSDLAEKVNLSTNMISEIEKGKKFVSDETISKIAGFFKKEPYRFFLPEEKWYLPEETIYIDDFLDNMTSSTREQWANYINIIKGTEKQDKGQF